MSPSIINSIIKSSNIRAQSELVILVIILDRNKHSLSRLLRSARDHLIVPMCICQVAVRLCIELDASDSGALLLNPSSLKLLMGVNFFFRLLNLANS